MQADSLPSEPPQKYLYPLSIFFAIIVGVVLGTLCAITKDSWFDKITLVGSVMGMALPSFFAAILFAWIFAFLLADYTGLNMFGSLYTISDFGDGEYLDLKNLILPAVTEITDSIKTAKHIQTSIVR